MRRDVLHLREFYATPLGRAARALVAAKVREAWDHGRGLDILGLGYATPYLEGLKQARRTVAAMPAAQGAEVWPAGEPPRVCLTHEATLPLRNALFDRVLLVHALEESDDPLAVLRETWRVLSPSGRVIIVAANRRGPWANAEGTPFGHGRPYTRSQLEALVREADLEPTAWSRALYLPPWGFAASWAEGLEQVGARLWPMLSGVILLEAVKQTYAVTPRGSTVRARVFTGGGLPAPASSAIGPTDLEQR